MWRQRCNRCVAQTPRNDCHFSQCLIMTSQPPSSHCPSPCSPRGLHGFSLVPLSFVACHLFVLSLLSLFPYRIRLELGTLKLNLLGDLVGVPTYVGAVGWFLFHLPTYSYHSCSEPDPKLQIDEVSFVFKQTNKKMEIKNDFEATKSFIKSVFFKFIE